MLTGEPQVVIGTRSAVFAPLPQLSLIILDEEHDGSFKQDSPIPTYHARTVAQWRAELDNCPLVLGSATPSLETWLNIRGQGSGVRDQGRKEDDDDLKVDYKHINLFIGKTKKIVRRVGTDARSILNI